VRDAYDARATQLQESLSALALDLARRDAHRILMLRVRLDDLHPAPDDRLVAASQLNEIVHGETVRLAGRSAGNARTLLLSATRR
jgi:hypothetical protein